MYSNIRLGKRRNTQWGQADNEWIRPSQELAELQVNEVR